MPGDLGIRPSLTIGDDLPIAALTDTPTRILPAAGHTTPRTVFDYHCAQELADLVDTQITEFPGGHNGNTTHPRAYTSRLHITPARDSRDASPLRTNPINQDR